MSTGRNLCLLAVLAGAFASNPDEHSFRRHLEVELKRKDGESGAIESRVASFLASHAVRRRNFYLFSLIRMPSEGSTYFGAFGNWIRLPGRRPNLS